jgi:hypothetical protein
LSVLLHIGYHKTATSWLQGHLFKHPESPLRTVGKKKVDAPARQIIRARPLEFDAAAVRALFEPQLRRISDAGLLPVVSNERLSGHPSSGGYDSKEIADRLAAVFPEGRVLIVVREQRSVIHSVYKQYVLAGGPLSFEQFVEAPVDPGDRVPGFDFRFYEYHHLLDHYRDRFGPDSVLVLAYEQFVRDPRGFVRAIGEFAGRQFDDALIEALPYGSMLKRTPSAVVIEATRVGNRVARRSQYNPAPFVDSPWLSGHLRKLARGRALATIVPRGVAGRKDDALRREVAEAVGDRYRESNGITAELSGLDLGGYGWAL